MSGWFKNLTSIKRPGPYVLISLSLAAFSLLLFGRLAQGLLGGGLAEFDQFFSSIIIGWRTEALTRFMLTLTKTGYKEVMIPAALVISLLFLVWFRSGWEALTFGAGLTGGWGAMELLKLVFQRARPSGISLEEVVGYSFPSGHAVLAVVFYGFLLYFFWLKVKNFYARLAATAFLSLFALGVGISRIYLGVHYPSDVAAGWAFGVFWLISCILASQWVRYYWRGA